MITLAISHVLWGKDSLRRQLVSHNMQTWKQNHFWGFLSLQCSLVTQKICTYKSIHLWQTMGILSIYFSDTNLQYSLQKKAGKGGRSVDMLLLLLVLTQKVLWSWSEFGDKSHFIFLVKAIVNMWRQLLVLILIIKPLLSLPAGKNERRKRKTQV